MTSAILLLYVTELSSQLGAGHIVTFRLNLFATACVLTARIFLLLIFHPQIKIYVSYIYINLFNVGELEFLFPSMPVSLTEKIQSSNISSPG